MTTEQTQPQPGAAKRRKKHVWLAAIVVVLTAIIASFLWSLRNSRSIDERLAEIEAARAIPDSENAAVVYNKLVAETEQMQRKPDFLDENADRVTIRRPWSATEYPELAKWIKGHQATIDSLLHASSFDKCRFPIADYTNQLNLGTVDRLSAMRGWTHLLARAANNDIEEGRTDDAIVKCRCVIQLARHLYQQPILIEYYVGIAVEGVGLERLYRLLTEGDLIERQIRAIEEFHPTIRNDWPDVSTEIRKVERLLSRKMYHPLANLKKWWLGPSLKQTHDIHLRTVSSRRVLKIMIELRRYKNKHGRWPETLDGIKAFGPTEVFVDPISGDSFVYKLADDTFKLYSKGKNKIDEDGQRNVTFDPNTYESIEHEDDRLFWPPNKMPEKKEDSADDK